MFSESSEARAPSGRGAVCTIASVLIPIAAILFGTAKAAEANLPMPLTSVANSSAPSNPPTEAEIEDDIVCAFFHGGYGNLHISGGWKQWGGSGYQPPNTWASHYIPNYPDPNCPELYDSSDIKVLRWQDKAMARAGIDIAILGWSSPNDYIDDVLAKACRICKNVKWSIYYELDPKQASFFSLQYNETNNSTGTQLPCSSRPAG